MFIRSIHNTMLADISRWWCSESRASTGENFIKKNKQQSNSLGYSEPIYTQQIIHQQKYQRKKVSLSLSVQIVEKKPDSLRVSFRYVVVFTNFSYFALTKILKTKRHEINTQQQFHEEWNVLSLARALHFCLRLRERLIELFLAPTANSPPTSASQVLLLCMKFGYSRQRARLDTTATLFSASFIRTRVQIGIT